MLPQNTFYIGAISSLRHNLIARLVFDQRPQPSPNQGMIINERYTGYQAHSPFIN